MFGEKLQALLDDDDISQSSLANHLGITSPAVNRWCNNVTQPDHDMLVKIANYFNVSTDYLLGNQLNDEIIKNDEENKQILNNVSTDLDNSINKALYSKLHEIKNEKDKRQILNIIQTFIDEVDKNEN